ncbi:uncharacterized protein DUF3305 [Roseibium hamelinense]|uniref:Uncharacterized protein DUF3305 n=1 Tax=Roseibium hamelinense TaxID=150831 RepID=A0A562T7G3_9HYPH|nr:DUF3305 domain-containing protein [Roseibium hamelinense]TWI89559.1 uncharacterized protein DUF3305 [Roseibium hamelinense]
MEAEITRSLGIVLEKRPSSHRWADHVWKLAGVVPDMPATQGWQLAEMRHGTEVYHLAPADLTLHRRMGEAYDANIETENPALWVLLDDAPDMPVPYELRSVTVDPYEAQGFMDSAEGLVERLSIPAEILHWMVAFLRQMPEPEEFKKRKRIKVKVEEVKFGKDPIFAPGGKRSAGDAPS